MSSSLNTLQWFYADRTVESDENRWWRYVSGTRLWHWSAQFETILDMPLIGNAANDAIRLAIGGGRPLALSAQSAVGMR